MVFELALVLRMCGARDGVELSMARQKLCVVSVMDMRPTMIVSDLSQFEEVGSHPRFIFGDAVGHSEVSIQWRCGAGRHECSSGSGDHAGG